MTKKFALPLLAALPALLVSCRNSVDTSNYQRLGFNSYQECATYYRVQISQGLKNPCVRSSGGSSGSVRFYGPYYTNSGSSTRYVGYDAGGKPASTGLTYDTKSGRYGSFKAGGTSRGGFTSSGRSSSHGSFGG